MHGFPDDECDSTIWLWLNISWNAAVNPPIKRFRRVQAFFQGGTYCNKGGYFKNSPLHVPSPFFFAPQIELQYLCDILWLEGRPTFTRIHPIWRSPKPMFSGTEMDIMTRCQHKKWKFHPSWNFIFKLSYHWRINMSTGFAPCFMYRTYCCALQVWVTMTTILPAWWCLQSERCQCGG